MKSSSLLFAAIAALAMAHSATAAVASDGVGSGGGFTAVVPGFGADNTIFATQQEKPCTWLEIRCGGGGLGPIIIGGCEIKINNCPVKAAVRREYPCWEDYCGWQPTSPGRPGKPPVPWMTDYGQLDLGSFGQMAVPMGDIYF